mmetsp:Transcript_3004/g.6329  ORF Transcript_3004/g.6329 Transcript_3004/m.6329 type:complete len:83 (-) Transcript_3004:630-878(-)
MEADSVVRSSGVVVEKVDASTKETVDAVTVEFEPGIVDVLDINEDTVVVAPVASVVFASSNKVWFASTDETSLEGTKWAFVA